MALRIVATVSLILFAGLALTATSTDETPAERGKRLKKELGDGAFGDRWIYEDVEAARAAARKQGKPLMVVARCVP